MKEAGGYILTDKGWELKGSQPESESKAEEEPKPKRIRKKTTAKRTSRKKR